MSPKPRCQPHKSKEAAVGDHSGAEGRRLGILPVGSTDPARQRQIGTPSFVCAHRAKWAGPEDFPMSRRSRDSGEPCRSAKRGKKPKPCRHRLRSADFPGPTDATRTPRNPAVFRRNRTIPAARPVAGRYIPREAIDGRRTGAAGIPDKEEQHADPTEQVRVRSSWGPLLTA